MADIMYGGKKDRRATYWSKTMKAYNELVANNDRLVGANNRLKRANEEFLGGFIFRVEDFCLGFYEFLVGVLQGFLELGGGGFFEGEVLRDFGYLGNELGGFFVQSTDFGGYRLGKGFTVGCDFFSEVFIFVCEGVYGDFEGDVLVVQIRDFLSKINSRLLFFIKFRLKTLTNENKDLREEITTNSKSFP